MDHHGGKWSKGDANRTIAQRILELDFITTGLWDDFSVFGGISLLSCVLGQASTGCPHLVSGKSLT